MVGPTVCNVWESSLYHTRKKGRRLDEEERDPDNIGESGRLPVVEPDGGTVGGRGFSRSSPTCAGEKLPSVLHETVFLGRISSSMSESSSSPTAGGGDGTGAPSCPHDRSPESSTAPAILVTSVVATQVGVTTLTWSSCGAGVRCPGTTSEKRLGTRLCSVDPSGKPGHPVVEGSFEWGGYTVDLLLDLLDVSPAPVCTTRSSGGWTTGTRPPRSGGSTVDRNTPVSDPPTVCEVLATPPF